MSETVLETPASIPSLPDIIARYADGEAMNTLAKESGKHRVTLWRWMLSDLGKEGHQTVKEQCLITRVADSELELDEVYQEVKSNPACNLARARELVNIAEKRMKYSRMDLERRCPHLYGQKMETKTDTTITVIVQRQTPQPVVDEAKLIESAVVSTQNDESISEATSAV